MRRVAWLTSRLLGYSPPLPPHNGRADGELLAMEWLPCRPWQAGAEVARLRYASDGLAVVGYWARPRDGAAGRRPLLIYNRGGLGPHGVLDREHLSFLCQLVTRGDFVGLASQYRGNEGGQGEDRAGDGAVRDVMHLLRLARALPGVDPTRCVMLGFSRGAGMALMAQRQGVRPLAVATIGLVSDSEQAFRQGSLLMKSAVYLATGGLPRTRPLEHYKRSPLLWPQDISSPLLLLHGEADGVVCASQSRNLARVLVEREQPHELHVLPGGDHKLTSHREERRDLVLDFFARALTRPRVHVRS